MHHPRRGILIIGALFFISNSYMRQIDGFLLSNFFLNLGGTVLFLPSFQLSNAFPKHSGIVVDLVTCVFDASSAVFVIYQLIWKQTNGSFTPEKFFTIYLLVPVSIMPKQRYHTMPELEKKLEKAHDSTRDIHISDDDFSDDLSLSRIRSHRADRRQAKIEQIEKITGDAEERHERMEQMTSLHVHDEAWGVLHGLSVREQMKTPWFMLLLLITAFQMLRMNYFIATISSQYSYMLSLQGADRITAFFNAALPIGGIAATPVIAVILNTLSVTDITAKVIGYATFCRVYDTITCLSGLVNSLQPVIDTIVSSTFRGDPLPVNVALCAIGTVLAVVFTAYVTHKTRNVHKRATRLEENSALLEMVEEYGTMV